MYFYCHVHLKQNTIFLISSLFWGILSKNKLPLLTLTLQWLITNGWMVALSISKYHHDLQYMILWNLLMFFWKIFEKCLNFLKISWKFSKNLVKNLWKIVKIRENFVKICENLRNFEKFCFLILDYLKILLKKWKPGWVVGPSISKHLHNL